MPRSVNIRCSLQDGDVVKRALLALGADGEAALKRIERGGKPASAGLKAVDTAAKEARSSIENLASRGGAAASVLRAFGPAGLVAGAALGAVVVGIGAVMHKAREAVNAFDDLQDAADRIGVGTEFLQGLRFAVGQTGGDIEKTEAALDKLNAVIGDVARGGAAEAEKTFKRLGVSITDSQGKVKSLERILPELADGFSKLGSAADRAAVAKDFFGKGNQAFARVLVEGAEGLRRQIALAREMGAVIDADLVRKGAEAKDKLEALAMVVNAQLNGAVVDAAPLIVKMGEAFAGLAKWIGMTADAWNDLPDQRVATLTDTLSKLQKELAGLEDRRAALKDGFFAKSLGLDPDLSGFDKQIAALKARVAEYRAVIEDKNYQSFEGRRAAGMGFSNSKELEGFSQAIQETIDKLKEQEEQAKRTGRELAVYNALLGHENARTEERAAIAAQAIKTFDAEEAGRKREEQTRKDRAKADKEAADAERKLQQVRREGERVTDDVATAEEKRAKALQEINDLLAANAIGEETARRARQKVEDDYLGERTDVGAGFERGFNKVQKDAADFAGAAEDLVVNAYGNMEDAAVEFARTGKLSFSSLVDGMIADLARLAFRMAATGVFEAVGGAFGSAFGGAPAPGVAPGTNGLGFLSFGGPRAGGGDVWPGHYYQINERGDRGPEGFIPTVPGKIVASGAMAAMSRGSGGFNFAPVTNNDFRGADSSTIPKVQAMLDQRDRQWKRDLPALIREHQAHSNI